MRPIDADALKEVKFHPLPYTHIVPTDADAESYKWGWNDAIDAIIESAPPIDAVSRGVHEQVMWERDLAISQLNEIGKSWGEKMDNVATVVRCKDCKYWGMHKSLNAPWCFEMHIDKSEDGFCDSGERREDAD